MPTCLQIHQQLPEILSTSTHLDKYLNQDLYALPGLGDDRDHLFAAL